MQGFTHSHTYAAVALATYFERSGSDSMAGALEYSASQKLEAVYGTLKSQCGGMGMKRGRDRGSVVRGLKPHTPSKLE